jgi:hypothetical protein
MNGELRQAARTVALFALVGGLGACSWFTDFKEQPKFDPWESPSDTIPMRGNPQNSVSVYGTAAPGYRVARVTGRWPGRGSIPRRWSAHPPKAAATGTCSA